MGLFFANFVDDYLLSDSFEVLLIEEFVDHAVGIDDDERGTDARENFVFLVSADDIAEHFGLIEHVHVAHVSVILFLWKLEGLVEGHWNLNGSALSLKLAFDAVIAEFA